MLAIHPLPQVFVVVVLEYGSHLSSFCDITDRFGLNYAVTRIPNNNGFSDDILWFVASCGLRTGTCFLTLALRVVHGGTMGRCTAGRYHRYWIQATTYTVSSPRVFMRTALSWFAAEQHLSPFGSKQQQVALKPRVPGICCRYFFVSMMIPCEPAVRLKTWYNSWRPAP